MNKHEEEDVEYRFKVPIISILDHRVGNVTYEIHTDAWFHAVVTTWMGAGYAEQQAWKQTQEAGHKLDFDRNAVRED